MDGWMDEEKEHEFQQDLPPSKPVLYVSPNTLKVGGERMSAINILNYKQLLCGPAQSIYCGPVLWAASVYSLQKLLCTPWF